PTGWCGARNAPKFRRGMMVLLDAVTPKACDLVANRLAAEAVAPALDVPDGGGGEVHGAAQGAGIAVTLEKIAPCRRGLRRIVVDAHYQLRIPCLQWRMDQVAGQHRGIIATPDTDGKMVGGVSRCRHQSHMVVERMLAAD